MKYILDNLYWMLPLLITSVITPTATYIVGRNKTSKQEILNRLDENDKLTNLNMQVSTSILRRELKESAAALISQKYATIEDKELWEADYEIYENMIEILDQQNGLIEHLRAEVLNLSTFREEDN